MFDELDPGTVEEPLGAVTDGVAELSWYRVVRKDCFVASVVEAVVECRRYPLSSRSHGQDQLEEVDLAEPGNVVHPIGVLEERQHRFGRPEDERLEEQVHCVDLVQ